MLKIRPGLVSAALCGVFLAFISSVTGILFESGAAEPVSLLVKLVVLIIFYLIPMAFFVVGLDHLGFTQEKTTVAQQSAGLKAITARLLSCFCGAIAFGLAYTLLAGKIA